MNITKTKLEGCFIIEPKIFDDGRGYFFESYNKERFDHVLEKEVNFVQDNESFSSRGVLRGLHFQRGKFAQAKLVRVTSGEVLDVAVDVRPDSKTFLKHVSVHLSGKNKKQLFVPRGFAHGFIVLSETAVFNYKCDNYYNKESESGIVYNDVDLKIDWIIPEEEIVVSDKDIILPSSKNIVL